MQTKAGTAAQFLFGASIVVAGSRLLVEGAVSLAVYAAYLVVLVGLMVSGVAALLIIVGGGLVMRFWGVLK